jgi:DUF1365 family protein
MWVVDIDRTSPSFGRGSVRAEDHLDGRPGTLRESLRRYAAAEGVPLPEGRVLLAAQPRAFGFCFNPISVWWCLDASGAAAVTVIEVHNTYGDRHAYLLRPRADGRADVRKAMYVSPFHGVDGVYEVIAPVPDRQLDLRVTLRTDGGERFSASLVGREVEAAPWWSLLATWRDALRIRIHGIRLWARRLPVQPRPAHHQEALK